MSIGCIFGTCSIRSVYGSSVSLRNIDRRLWYEKLIDILSLDVSVDTLRRTLAKKGYSRCIALGQPDMKEKNILERLDRARAHVNWTRDD